MSLHETLCVVLLRPFDWVRLRWLFNDFSCVCVCLQSPCFCFLIYLVRYLFSADVLYLLIPVGAAGRCFKAMSPNTIVLLMRWWCTALSRCIWGLKNDSSLILPVPHSKSHNAVQQAHKVHRVGHADTSSSGHAGLRLCLLPGRALGGCHGLPIHVGAKLSPVILPCGNGGYCPYDCWEPGFLTQTLWVGLEGPCCYICGGFNLFDKVLSCVNTWNYLVELRGFSAELLKMLRLDHFILISRVYISAVTTSRSFTGATKKSCCQFTRTWRMPWGSTLRWMCSSASPRCALPMTALWRPCSIPRWAGWNGLGCMWLRLLSYVNLHCQENQHVCLLNSSE